MFIHLEVQDIDHINRQEVICISTCFHLALNLECRVIYGPLWVERLFSSLYFDDYSCAAIGLAEHVINHAFCITFCWVHFLVNELQVNNLPVRDNLIEEFNHHVLCGLSSKDQFEHVIIK